MKYKTPLPTATKTCSVCHQEKLISEYYATRKSSDGLLTRCKDCHKAAVLARQKERPDLVNLRTALWKRKNREKVTASELRRRAAWTPKKRGEYYQRNDLWRYYGVTTEWYNDTLASQGGGCAVCGTLPGVQRKRFAVDHCHVTGTLRGILCHHCNTALARLEQIDGWDQKALAYLSKFKK
jgi:Autographiviridae endonuclease VII